METDVPEQAARTETLYDLVHDFDKDTEEVDYHQKHLAAARLRQTVSRERIVTVLKAREGRAFSVGGRLFKPVFQHLRHITGISDFEVIEFDAACDIGPLAMLETAIHQPTNNRPPQHWPEPPADPPPPDCEPQGYGQKGS